jgi:hypothetical protein
MPSCSVCGTHTGTHWPDCPHGSQPHASRDEAAKWKGQALLFRAALRDIAEGGQEPREVAKAALAATK